MRPLTDPAPDSPAAARAATRAAVREAAVWGAFAVGAVLAAPVGGQMLSVFAPALAAAALLLGRASGREPPAVGALALLTALYPVVAVAAGGTVTHGFAASASAVVFAVLPWLLGRYLRRRADAASFGWRRAELLERERDLVAERERLRERARIAEEMHDSLGHELSLIVVRAGAMQVGPGYGEAELRDAAGELRAGAAGAVERLQEIIGILRETGDPLAGEPLGQGVAELVERARAAGMDIALHGADLAEDAPEPVRRALARAVQEALTNAAKHAPGAAVAVHVEREAGGGWAVRVRNGPPPRGGPIAAGVAGGRGLAGLAERLRPLGGAVEAGPVPGGGFETAARVPAGAAPGSGGAGGAAELASRFASAQRRALRAAVLAPAGLLAALAALWLAYYLTASAGAVLAPADFDRLRVGQEQARVEAVLPPLSMLDPPAERVDAPGGEARCRFYRSEVTLPGAATTAYRLCFAHGRLVVKETVPVGTRPEGGDR
ncbi:histidine kinase [Streptomonospora sp. S1-112]|uniref:histidine kinase n=1 Tax=Streptomonospora mangrovi TaxID=2883123 RepID=A0A9X3SMD8_9ACTN|nr:histidine kinase [Streptomonospora mangrovi]MDA0564251.1 histidine kinase [Streptomonospora mangrovi]